MKRGSRESISSNRISSRYTDSAAHSRAILSGKDIFHYGYHHDRRSPSHTLSASEYHCCIELSSELWAAASLPPPLQTDLFVAAAVASLSFLLSPVVFTFEEVASKPSQGRRFLSRPPFLHIATNKASLWAEKRERERRAVLQIRHWHHCDDTYTHSQEKQIRSRRQQQQIAGAWWKSAGG